MISSDKQKIYNSTEAAKASREKYRLSDKGKEAARRGQIAYGASVKGQEYRRKYNADPIVKERKKQHARKFRSTEEGKAYHRDAQLKRSYGITREQWKEIFLRQDSKCRICHTQEPTTKHRNGWHTDHDHVTGKVRGILCHFCNVLLGHAKEDVEILKSAIGYLEATKAD